METALACEAPMHVQHCRDRSAVMQTRNNALKWIKRYINNTPMNSGILTGLGRSCQSDKPLPEKKAPRGHRGQKPKEKKREEKHDKARQNKKKKKQ